MKTVPITRKIISLILLSCSFFAVLFLFGSDTTEPYYQVYSLYTWNSANSDLPEMEPRPFFLYLYSAFKNDYSHAFLLMPRIEGLYIYNDDGEIIGQNENAGEFYKNGDDYVFVIIDLIVYRYTSLKRMLMFSSDFSVDPDNPDNITTDFYINFFYYKNYLVPDLNNPSLFVDPELSIPGQIAMNMIPQYFAVKQLDPDVNFKKLRDPIGLYTIYYYDYTKMDYEVFLENNEQQGVFLDSNYNVYDYATNVNNKLEPLGDKWGVYSFDAEFLKITNISNSNKLNLLKIESTFVYPESPIEGAAYNTLFLTSTYFESSKKNIISIIEMTALYFLFQ